MTALDELQELLRALPWSERCRLVVQEDKKGKKGLSVRGLQLQRGAMYAWATLRADGRLVITYEPALHTATSVALPPAEALNLLLAALRREQLHVVPGFEGDAPGQEEDDF